MPAQLVSLADGPSILLDKPILLVGRHPECDIQIDSTKVSRRHCCIAEVNDYLVVRDLGSTNGIRINGVRVLEGRLKPDDELTIGGLRYRVTWDLLPVSSTEGVDPEASTPRQAHSARLAEEEYGLESCDDPVPLAERVDEAGLSDEAIPLAEPVFDDYEHPSLKAQAAPEPKKQEPNHARPEQSPKSKVLPDKIKLVPESEFDLPSSHFPSSESRSSKKPVASDSGLRASDP
jgi:predicted component of type VI protein secretion system